MGTIPSSSSAPTITGDPQRPPSLLNRMRNPFVGVNPEIAPLPSSAPSPASPITPSFGGDPQRPPTMLNRMNNPFVGVNPKIAPLPREAAPFAEPTPRQPLDLKPLPPAPALPDDYPSGITNPGRKYTVPSLDGVKYPNGPNPDALPPTSRNSAPIPSSAPSLPMPIGAGAGAAQAARNAVNAGVGVARAGLGATAVGAVASAGVSIALGASPQQAIAGAAGAVAGGVAGGFIGGAIGSIGGPAGIAIGATIGRFIGSFAGGALAGGIPQNLSPANQGTGTPIPINFPVNGLRANQNYVLKYDYQSKNANYVSSGFAYGSASGASLPALFAGFAAYVSAANGSFRVVATYVEPVPPILPDANAGPSVPQPDNPFGSPQSGPVLFPTDAKGNPVTTSPAPSPSPTPSLSPAHTPSPSPVPASTPTAAPNPYPVPIPVPIPGLSPSPPSLQPAPAPALTPTPNVYPPSITNPQPGSTTGPDRTPAPVKSTPQITTPFGIQPGTDTRPSPLPNPGQAPNPKPVQNSTPDNQGKLKTTPDPEPQTPALPSTRSRNGDCCDPLGGSGGDNELLMKIAKAVGVDDFPATLPLLAGSQQETVSNIPELVVWSVKCLDSVIGLFPAEIEIITGEGTKKQVKLETVSHALEELFAALVVVAEDADAAVNIGARTAVEAIQAKISARQSGEVAEAIAKFLGFTGQAKQRQVKIGFTPSAAGVDNKLQNQEMADFLKPSTQNYVGYECIEKDELLPIIKRILQDSEISRAALFHPLKPNPKDAQEQGITGEYLRKMKKRDPSKPTPEEKSWDKFKEQVKKTGAEIDEKKTEK